MVSMLLDVRLCVCVHVRACVCVCVGRQQVDTQHSQAQGHRGALLVRDFRGQTAKGCLLAQSNCNTFVHAHLYGEPQPPCFVLSLMMYLQQ